MVIEQWRQQAALQPGSSAQRFRLPAAGAGVEDDGLSLTMDTKIGETQKAAQPEIKPGSKGTGRSPLPHQPGGLAVRAHIIATCRGYIESLRDGYGHPFGFFPHSLCFGVGIVAKSKMRTWT